MKRHVSHFIRMTPLLAVLLVNTPDASADNKQQNVIAFEQATPVFEYIIKQDSSRDIQKLLKHYEQTAVHLKKSVAGLTEEQLNFIPGKGQWSISQCLEHIILSEPMIFGMFKQEISKPDTSKISQKPSYTDEEIIKSITNRSEKYQAPEMLQPTGKYHNINEALIAFENGRKEIIDYIKNADIKALRNHISQGPAGPVDGYQNLLFITTHSDRHILQIEEIKVLPNFPKK
ncbi:DinB family protein [Sphingobacterium chuzhouense]|uniref:DinB family protein n=1 Tax=Sphingobacterium chuzhouense TaxID=1742264 RepID=A0ABR7XTF5_9SPHI|nr:DinB family protein [Sphingobacterium chuzhouense]MBD1422468.1 DinB family protein [Sphingobacterium chuzhouense]